MSFIRIKEIKKNGKTYRYAYLVQNKWKRKLQGSRQKVGKYLGKVIQFSKEKEENFLTYVSSIEEYLKNDKKKIIRDLVCFELGIRGFKKNENLLIRENLFFDLNKLNFFSDRKEEKIAAEMNEGFLCNYTLEKLLNFKKQNQDEMEDGLKLAKAFLETGLNVPKEIFIGYFAEL